ncbi:hypothetical protein K435DRAFT_838280 [Dendrothele bispora CBS 962.96]|uniref:Uncharacterized protein n=1 Tax=Dendrothele bispora (strain CBS 962.96) TaxID=1314807 RepID=A0A4S8M767_DENBC|nr:hypothetical protein K435DRAFT_838280 [Dendrothele bispora CBS 962.96]
MSDEPLQSVLTSDDAFGVETIIVTESIEGLLYGLEFFLTFCTGYLLVRQGVRNSTARFFLLIAIAIMLVDSTAVFAGNIVFGVVQIKGLVGDSNYDPTPAMAIASIVLCVFVRISYLLGDIIVVWRAWILFDKWSFARILLTLCMLLSFGVAVVSAVFDIRTVLDDNFVFSTPVRYLLPVALLFTNVVTTVLIGYKSWQYRAFIKVHLGEMNRKSKVEGILILLVESGSLYCALWLVSLLGVVGVLNYTVDDYVSTLAPHAETIYPNIIILLTTLQKTHWDTTLQGSCQIPSMSMCFALAPIRSETRDLNRSVPVGFGQSHVIPTTINHHEPGVGPSSSSVSLKEDQSHQVEQEYKHREEVAVAVRRIQSNHSPLGTSYV